MWTMVDIYGHENPHYVHAFYVHRLCIIDLSHRLSDYEPDNWVDMLMLEFIVAIM